MSASCAQARGSLLRFWSANRSVQWFSRAMSTPRSTLGRAMEGPWKAPRCRWWREWHLRRLSLPVIEQHRVATNHDTLIRLLSWKARHHDSATLLQPQEAKTPHSLTLLLPSEEQQNDTIGRCGASTLLALVWKPSETQASLGIVGTIGFIKQFYRGIDGPRFDLGGCCLGKLGHSPGGERSRPPETFAALGGDTDDTLTAKRHGAGKNTTLSHFATLGGKQFRHSYMFDTPGNVKGLTL